MHKYVYLSSSANSSSYVLSSLADGNNGSFPPARDALRICLRSQYRKQKYNSAYTKIKQPHTLSLSTIANERSLETYDENDGDLSG